MIDMTSHYQRESSDTCRPQDIGIRSSLRSPFHRSLMDRPQLIHVVALIGSRTCIHKREHSGNQQSRFMMCHGERTCENSTCFTVLSLAITKKQRIGSGIIMSQFTGLPDETTGQHCAVIHSWTGRDYEVVTNYPVTDMYRRCHITIDASIG